MSGLRRGDREVHRLDRWVKGAPLGLEVERSDLEALDWHLTDDRTATPVAVLRRDHVAHNIEVMGAFCALHDVRLAPHAKTTMSRELVQDQLDAGAWGLTVAVPHQAAVLLGWGVDRVLIANEVVDEAALRWLARELAGRPDLTVHWYLDSRAGLEAAERALAGVLPAHVSAGVLVELGHPGGRTGVRSVQEALELARAVHASEHLHLAGIAGYEGTVGAGREPDVLARVRHFLEEVARLYAAVHDESLLGGGGSGVVTAGGSAYFDLVTQTLGPLRELGAELVLRSGCYLTHDHGFYEQMSPASTAEWPHGRFRPALEVWGTVLSRPEESLALLNLGRRDVSYDLGLPLPIWHARRGSRELRPMLGAQITALADQHAFMQLPEGSEVRVGDLVGVGVSHPCTTFDRWPAFLILDEDHRVVDFLSTSF